MPNTRITNFEVEYYLEDTNARQDAVLSTSDNQSFGDIDLLETRGTNAKYMTCEKGLLILLFLVVLFQMKMGNLLIIQL